MSVVSSTKSTAVKSRMPRGIMERTAIVVRNAGCVMAVVGSAVSMGGLPIMVGLFVMMALCEN